jgi:hypothetical protein
MDFTGTLVVSRVKSNINGYFSSDPKYKYTCPELRVAFDLDASEEHKQDSLIKNTVAQKFWQPQPQDVIVENDQPVKKDTPALVKAEPIIVAKDLPAVAKTTPSVVEKDSTAAVAIIEKEESLKTAKKSIVKTQVPVIAPPIASAIAPQGPSEKDLMIKAFE